MMSTINIDIGGTFTDCLVIGDGRIDFTKSPTTGYDLSVGFMKVIRDLTAQKEISIEELLRDTEVIRYSTTIAMNTLLQRTGPRLGLITTIGFEDIIPIGRGSSWMDAKTIKEMRNVARIAKPKPLIHRDMTVGVKERIDSMGKVLRTLDEEDFLEKLQYLVDNGARGFVVSLLWSFLNPTHENKIKEIIRSEYPEVYLGSMPVVLSSEVCPKQFEYTRTVTTILNAYLHQSMWKQLSGMGDELRGYGYKKPIVMIHNSGGAAEVFRTTAVQTYNGGPVAGLIGGAHVGSVLGHENVVVSDMGGTSFDLGIIVQGSTRLYDWQPIIDRWWVDMTMLETRSIGAGGGSIARVNPLLGNRLEVGPHSAGSMPGPVCYDLGGEEPTVTDADVVLGYINPDFYYAGKMRLNKESAVEAIRGRIARPLNMEVEEAALLIRKISDANMGDVIIKETLLRGYDPKEFVLFAFGGAGPIHCCGYGFYAGISKLVVFPFSPVFCAFGSAAMDISHIYEKSTRIALLTPFTMQYDVDFEAFNTVVQELKEIASRDVEGEGFNPEDIIYSLELDMKYGGQLNIHRARSPRLILNTEADAKAVYEQFEREYGERYSPIAIYPQGGVEIYNLILRATIPTKTPELPVHPKGGTSPPKNAFVGKRRVFWEEYGQFKETPVYAQSILQNGNVIEGPAIIEAEYTSTVLPPRKRLEIDEYLNQTIEEL